MKIHILGIGGTFMGGLAVLAKELGFEVSGSDCQVYPPMSDQLRATNITLVEGYDPSALRSPPPDLVVIGNALSRGNPCVEHVLDSDLAYMSGPQWLARYVLPGRWVLAVSGTHGKTTTASLLAFILDRAALTPGFLIGGVAENFGVSARLGKGRLFVVEADEYDSAFFDKRSKFIHYLPRSLIINNIEFDHADIFSDLKAIQTQFHHLVRTVPSRGLILYPADDEIVCGTLAMGCWSTRESFGEGEGALWGLSPLAGDHRHFQILLEGRAAGEVRWDVLGRFNALNALAAVAAARHAGVEPAMACEILRDFQSVKRRLQLLETVEGIAVYDDFAHHPTAIALTIEALRSDVGNARIVAVFEPRSNTMKLGVHRNTLAQAFAGADKAILYQPEELSWDLRQATAALGENREVFETLDAMVDRLSCLARAGDHILIMSNGSFGGIHQKLIARLKRRA